MSVFDCVYTFIWAVRDSMQVICAKTITSMKFKVNMRINYLHEWHATLLKH